MESPARADNGWNVVADLPGEPLFQPSIASTETSVVVWGTTDPELPEPATRLLVYDLDKDEWAELAAGPLAARFGQVSIWTGDELIVWGGGPRGGLGGDGAMVRVGSGEWTEIVPGPLGPRSFNTAVWTGSEMLVWGAGAEGFPPGAAYSPDDDSWRTLSKAPIRARSNHTAVWTGKEMLVWGGVRVTEAGPQLLSDGAAYDPKDDSWRRLAGSPLTKRVGHSGVWTGSEMLVWGGGEPPNVQGDGASYDPASDSWSALPDPPIDPRIGHAAVWSGDRMLIWGGSSTSTFSDGASFDPASGTWSALPDAPIEGRSFPAASWTGEGMFVWGGTAADRALEADGAIFYP